MALGDNFMWDPDKAIQGETTDRYFSSVGAFEIVSFNFGLMPEGMTLSQSGEGESGGGESGGAGAGASGGGGKTARSTMGMNAGLLGGVKLGGTVSKRLGGGGGSSTGGGGGKLSGGSSGGGGSRGKPKFGTLTINKFVDEASTSLYKFCSTGDIIPTLNLAIRKSGGDPLLYLQYVFRYNQVTGVAWSGGEGDKRPQEQFTLEFKAMGMQYIGQSARGSSTSSPKVWLWSVETLDSNGLGQSTLEIGGESPKSPVFLPGIVETPTGNL
jgi:type VI protein secretion system component Hcp